MLGSDSDALSREGLQEERGKKPVRTLIWILPLTTLLIVQAQSATTEIEAEKVAPGSKAVAEAAKALRANGVQNLGFEKIIPSPDEKNTLDAARGKIPGRIVWQSLRDNNWNIYSMRADGTDVRRLTDHPLDDENPAWSPDGMLIAFDTRRSGHRQVFTMKPDGSQQELLIDYAQHPCWSADGRFIVFERKWKIFLFTIAEKSERELVPGKLATAEMHPAKPGKTATQVPLTTTIESIKASGPAFSTDGKYLAFTTDARFPWEVAVMPLDGTRLKLLAWGCEPAWLPGTDRIIFTREAGRSGSDLLMRSAAGGRLKLVSSLEMPWGYEYAPAVSPDGRWLVWAVSRHHDPVAANYELFIRKFDDTKSKPLRLTFHTAPDRSPSMFTQTEADR